MALRAFLTRRLGGGAFGSFGLRVTVRFFFAGVASAAVASSVTSFSVTTSPPGVTGRDVGEVCQPRCPGENPSSLRFQGFDWDE